MSIFSKLIDFIFPLRGKPEDSELSNPLVRRFRINSKNEITTKILSDNVKARDDEELFLSLVENKCISRMDMIGFDRSWRYVMRHFPSLRGELWESRQKKAEVYRKNI